MRKLVAAPSVSLDGVEVARRKRQPGKDILIPGSATLVRCLLHEGLVDGLRLLLFPIVLGGGTIRDLLGDAR